ncbi:MAG: hypothetical protein AB8H79_19100, partial [Myxococcota bacterium]
VCAPHFDAPDECGRNRNTSKRAEGGVTGFAGAYWNDDGQCVILNLGVDSGEYRSSEPDDWCKLDLMDDPGGCP